ncbi:hypothetical protein GW17_00021910 [Ensete ventricosum]|nr:hypothetical protein GW17_00021910 [Ensete ventricosum]
MGNNLQATAASGAPARDDRRRPVRKRLPTAHQQGAAANSQPTACPQRATASRGDGAGRRGGRPLAGRLSVATRSAAAYVGAATQEG